METRYELSFLGILSTYQGALENVIAT